MTFDMQGNRENSIVLLEQFRMDTSKLTSTGAIYRNLKLDWGGGGGGGGCNPLNPPPDQPLIKSFRIIVTIKSIVISIDLL